MLEVTIDYFTMLSESYYTFFRMVVCAGHEIRGWFDHLNTN